MKHSITLYLLLLFSFQSNGQTSIYHEFPDSNAVWNFHSSLFMCLPFGGNVIEDYSVTMTGDTSINNQTYHKLFTPFIDSVQSGFCTLNTSGYKGAIREDIANKKVYFIEPLDSIEQLLYDFNWQVGDTVTGVFTNWNLGIIDTINSIDSVLVGGNYRKHWIIDPCYDISVIEGIGSKYGLFIPSPSCISDAPGYTLTCFSQDNIPLYPDTISSCNLITHLPNSDILENNIKIYPNPSSGPFYFEVTNNLIVEVELYDATGRFLTSFQVNSKKVRVIEKLKAGLYYIIMRDKNNYKSTFKLISSP
jgi:type IX secretion system substrate protein